MPRGRRVSIWAPQYPRARGLAYGHRRSRPTSPNHAKGGRARRFLAVTEDVTALGVRVANGFGHSALALAAMTET